MPDNNSSTIFPIFSDMLSAKHLEPDKCFNEVDVNSENLVFKDNSGGMPLCNNSITDNTFFQQVDTSGCCMTTNLVDKCPDGYDMGIDFLFGNDISRNICHKRKVRDIFSLHDQGPSLKKFFTLTFSAICFLLLSTLWILLRWLQYGSSMECLFYQSNCDNIGKDNRGRSSAIDYAFPDSIFTYPYQPCQPCVERTKMIGGNNGKKSKFISKFGFHYATQGKCITLDDNDKNKYCTREFPYNIPSLVDTDSCPGFIRVIFKLFGITIITYLLFYRKIMNRFLTKLSQTAENTIKTNKFISGSLFILLSGLIVPLFFIFGWTNPLIAITGPFSIPTILLSISGGVLSLFIFSIVLFILFANICQRDDSIDWCLTQGDKSGKSLINEKLINYYKIDFSKLMCSRNQFSNVPWAGVKFYMANFFLILFYLVTLVPGVLIALSLGSTIGTIYWLIQLLFSIFYYPLSNLTELIHIIQSHSDFLTMFFCIFVFASASSGFQKPDGSNPIRGIMGSVLAVIILYKLYKMFKS